MLGSVRLCRRGLVHANLELVRTIFSGCDAFSRCNSRGHGGTRCTLGGIHRAVLDDAAAYKLAWETKDEDALQSAIGSCTVHDVVEPVWEEASAIRRLIMCCTFNPMPHFESSAICLHRTMSEIACLVASCNRSHRLLSLPLAFADGTLTSRGLRGQVFEYLSHA